MTKLALVTGGTRGIGAAIAQHLQADGYRVVANYAANHRAATRFSAETGIPAHAWDIRDFEACRAGVAAIIDEHGAIDILVNNAGITRDVPFHKMTPAQWHDVMHTNLDGLFNMTRQVWEGMRAAGYGRVVNISSINGQRGQFGQVNYAAAKAGEIGFTKSLALEGARHGITVNAVAPGYVQTDMMQNVPPEILQSQILPQIPAGRLGTPEEVARCVGFLVSPNAGFITGATLSVNGGHYLA